VSFCHFPSGDGESNDGLGVVAMTWVTTAGTYTPAPATYLEYPYFDTTPTLLPLYRSDTYDATNVVQPDVISVVGTSVVVATTILPIARVGTGIVDADGNVFYVETVTSDTEFTVNATGMAIGSIQAFHPPTPSVVTYAANTEGLPSFEKLYGQLWTNFQTLRGGRTVEVTTRRFGQTDADNTTQSKDYATELGANILEGLEWVGRWDVPTAQTRAVGLQVSITVGDPITYFILGAMAFEFTPTGTRTSRGA
jgi:hypothetical protein